MKKALFLTLAIGSFAFMSCKKCQTCTTHTEQDYGSYTQEATVNNEYCGDEYDDAPEPTTTSQQSGGVTQTVTITCQDD